MTDITSFQDDFHVAFEKEFADFYALTIAVQPISIIFPNGAEMTAKSFYRCIGSNVLDINTQILLNGKIVGFSIHHSGTPSKLTAEIPNNYAVLNIRQRVENNYMYEKKLTLSEMTD